MDLEKTIQKINDLESEIAALKKAFSTQASKTNTLDDSVNAFLDIVRQQKKDIERVSSAVNSLGQFDPTITQVRIDINKKLDDLEKNRKAEEKTRENLLRNELNLLGQAVEKTSQKNTKDFDQKLRLHLDETARLVQRFKEVESSIEQKIQSDDDTKGSIDLLLNESNHYKKRLESFSQEVENFKKRTDEIRARQEIIQSDARANDNRLNEIFSNENERKQTFLEIVEKSTIIQREQERVWKDWSTQFDEAIQKIYHLLPELQNQQLEINKSKATFDEVTQRFERRINEVTELYRLLDDKFRQEWATYKGDADKKWTNISIVADEKNKAIEEQIVVLKDRILQVEDSTHEMQEALLLMSKEIQKGMQSLMNMVNGWMDAFSEIKSSR